MRMNTTKNPLNFWKRRNNPLLILGIVMALALFVPKPAEAALSYVGGASGTGTGATYSVTLPAGTTTGDLVIVVTGWTSNNVDGDPGVTTAGYTEEYDLYMNDTRDANLSVNWKIMGATPDTSVTVNGPNTGTYGGSTVVHVWRGADPTTPMDVPSISASAINGARPDCAAISPVTAGAYVIAAGLGTGSTTATAMTAPTGYGNALSVVGNGSTGDVVANIASRAWTSGSEDPAAWTGGVTSTSDSWAAVTLAIRSAPVVTVGTTGTQRADIYTITTGNYLGGAFTFTTDHSTVDVTGITLSELGTIAANTNLSNAKIYYETAATCSYDGDETLFGSAASFNGSQQAVITGTMPVGTSQVCAYVVLDVGSGAGIGNTIEIQITNPSTQVLASPASVTPSSAVAIANTTTVVKRPFTIGDCSGCHGYTSFFSDGTNRNTPSGLFKGSHNQHAMKYSIGCTACHLATGATNTHRSGTIQMTTTINGENGATYVKGTSWTQTSNPSAFTACSNLYCHSQGTGKATGDNRNLSQPTTTLAWGQTGSCNSCHGYPPSYANGATTWGGTAKANSHSKHKSQCSTCHSATTTDSTSISGTAHHADRNYDIVSGNGTTIGSYSYAASGGTCNNIYCHYNGTTIEASRQWGTTMPATYKCITCHKATMAITVGPLAGTGRRDPVVNEFGQAWGHRNTVRSAGSGSVADSDCIVCHLEGVYSTQTRSTCHGDGYIDLRDPDGTGEAEIKDISGNVFRFAKFSTSYSAGSRTYDGQLLNTIDNVLTQKFCLACHDSNGATNTSARSNNGGTGTQWMPFGGVNLGSSYTTTNGSAINGGIFDVKSQFTPTNSSVHPVRESLNRDFPLASRLQAPYNNQEPGRTGVQGGQRTKSVVLNCFDCHNSPTPITDRTVAAHGTDVTNHLRGTVYTSGLCTQCHTANYATNGGTTAHGSGSAFASISYNHQATTFATCNNCHLSTTGAAAPARPKPAQDVHGFDKLNTSSATDTLWPTGNTNNWRPYGFIRNTIQFTNTTTGPRPFRGTEAALTTGTPNCGNVGAACRTGSNMTTYSPGGQY